MLSFPLLTGLSFADAEERAGRILSGKHIPAGDPAVLRRILSLLDLTSLEGSDNQEKIHRLCTKAVSFKEKGLPCPAAVCVYPPFIRTVKEALKGSGIRTAATAAAFPSGQMPLSVKLEEVRYVIQQGADELDVVISRGSFLEGNHQTVFEELVAIRQLTEGLTLKVILETGELGSFENIAQASAIAIEAGADFIKTSTGKIVPAATESAVLVMLEVIRSYHEKSGKKIGIKPAGGISTPGQALNYYYLVKEILGNEWLQSGLFRIGASRLADRLMEIL